LFQSALVLCNLLADSSCVLNEHVGNTNTSIVEVGSGTGVLAIAAALLGCTITVTDLPHVMPQIQDNINSNLDPLPDAKGRVTCLPLSWGNSEHSAAIGKVDLILCSDCLYRDETHLLLLQTLKELSHPKTLIVVALEIRRFPVEQMFFDLADEDFTNEAMAVPFQEDDAVKVFLLRPK